jgi:hypothetical protein
VASRVVAAEGFVTGLAPFPYAGGKSRAADLVWHAFGDVNSYIEPFCGSAAVLLCRPKRLRFETINDADGLVVNFWRATQRDPEALIPWFDCPRAEVEIVARGRWLLSLGLVDRLKTDPGFYDTAAAGVWAWYMSCSISQAVKGTEKQQPRLIRQGVLGDGRRANILLEMRRLQDLLRDVRILCGPWQACLGPANQQASWKTDPIGVFLDPPYAGHELYTEGSAGISADVRAWAIEHGNDPAWRVVLCGYDGEHSMPNGWSPVAWQTLGRVSKKAKEVLWLSPHCQKP